MAGFYEVPALAGLVVLMGTRPLLMSLRSPAYPLLRREMNYRVLFVDEVAQLLFGTGATLLVASLTGSVWAIAVGVVVGAVASVAVSWRACPRRVGRPSRPVAAGLLRFSGPVFLNTLVMAAWLKMDALLGLKLLGADAFGLYVVSLGLAGAAEALVVRVCDVYFSALAQMPAADRDGWHGVQVSRTARLAGPAFALSIVVAPIAVRFMYDERYHPAGVLLAILLARLAVRAFGQFRFQHLLAQGRVRSATVGYAVALAVQASLIVPMAERYGPTGLAWSALASTVVVTLVQELGEWRRGTATFAALAWVGLWAATGLAVAL